MTGNEMVWDLTPLVESTDPAAIEKKLASMVAEAETLREHYRGQIGGLSAKGLHELLKTKDAFLLNFEGATMYCSLIYAADATNAIAKQLNDAARRASMQVGQAFAFIDIEVGRLLVDTPTLMDDPALTEYRHALKRLLRSVPHQLSEAEERVILVKDKNGVDAWELLQSDWLSTRTFDIELARETETLPYGRIIGFYQSQDRDLRRRAYQVVYEGLGGDDLVWASAIRAVCADHLQMCALRKYPTPMTQSLIANDVDQPTIDGLMQAIERHVGLYHRYLRLKAKLMGLNKLANYDIVAPLPHVPEKAYTWAGSRMEVVEAYRAFDEEVGGWVDEMYEKRRIDGEVRIGKESGAFCSSWLAGKSAYVLQSFNAKQGDVYTQAHELGHAVHAYLYARAQKPSNCEVGGCIAECGSIFGELLVTEHLLSKAKTRAEKQAILTYVLDEFGMIAFQVSARVFFEQSLYDALEKGVFLDGDTVATLWTTARDRIYGDTVDWQDVMKWEWTMKPHYYLANYRFYNYPYVFAQLFVFALYRLYREQGVAFVPKLKALLAAGASKSPRDLGAELGFDITVEAFWEKGMAQAEAFINALEETL
jgi:oligoendopeptidase F